MINRLSNLINRNRSAAKISQVLCSNLHPSRRLCLPELHLWSPRVIIRIFKRMIQVKASDPTDSSLTALPLSLYYVKHYRLLHIFFRTETPMF